MVSILKVTSIQDTSGNNETTTENIKKSYDGAAKAWVNFNGTGTIASRDSFNVTSLTDNGTGNYTITLTNAMTDTNQSALAGSHSGVTNAFNNGASNYLETSSAVRMMSAAMSSAAAADKAVCNSTVYGDLA